MASKIARTASSNHGYKDLVKEICGKDISKKEQQSDWGNPKLSEKQISYAAQDTEYLFDIAEKEQINFFGTGAKYIDYLKQNKVIIKDKYKLPKLKTIASTGSPLVQESFEYVYSCIKKNVHLASISGGTDIVSCFVTGNPNMDVYSGEIQCAALGMDVDIFDEKGIFYAFIPY